MINQLISQNLFIRGLRGAKGDKVLWNKMEKRKRTEKLLPIPGHSTFINKLEDIDDLKVLFCICETKISVVMRPFNQTKFCILHKLITTEKHVLSHGDFSRLVWLKAFCRIYSGFKKYSDPLKLFKFVRVQPFAKIN